MPDKSASFVKGNGLRLFQDDGEVELMNLNLIAPLGWTENLRPNFGIISARKGHHDDCAHKLYV